MNRKALFVSGLACAFLGGCQLENTDDVDQFREAVPTADAVAVDGPDTTGTSGRRAASGARGALTQAPATSAPAEWYTFTRDVRDGVNVVTAAVLVTVGFVVHTEPSSVSEDHAVWGPYDGDALDPVTWRLTVTRIGDHHYRYVVEGRRKADKSGAFLAVARRRRLRPAEPEPRRRHVQARSRPFQDSRSEPPRRRLGDRHDRPRLAAGHRSAR